MCMHMLKGCTYNTKMISNECKKQMFRLLLQHYDRVTWNQFQQDLAEKNHVIILFDSTEKKVRGFSTIKTFDIIVDNQKIHAVFSGDTIIHPDFWGGQELMRKFCSYLSCEMNNNLSKSCYWFLISKGYKTYKYLPLFFHNFYPCYDKNTPQTVQAIIDELAVYKFGDYYDVQKGIISFNGTKDSLKKGVADLCETRLNNPHIKFFLDRNPGYLHGDELVCVAELTKTNLKKSFFRFV